jgi:hypothetical protein
MAGADVSETNGRRAATHWAEPESVAKSMAQSMRAREARQREYEELLRTGGAVNLKAAMARCFAAGNHGTEALRGGFD